MDKAKEQIAPGIPGPLLNGGTYSHPQHVTYLRISVWHGLFAKKGDRLDPRYEQPQYWMGNLPGRDRFLFDEKDDGNQNTNNPQNEADFGK
jgi:hypothetical protein